MICHHIITKYNPMATLTIVKIRDFIFESRISKMGIKNVNPTIVKCEILDSNLIGEMGTAKFII